jgi:hypothetical protein
VLPPAQDVTQPAPQLPEHDACPAHAVVQPVPQLTLHVFFDWQLKVALLGRPASAEPPSPCPAPRSHVPPDWQSHVVPVHEHAPVQAMSPPADCEAPEHAAKGRASTASNTKRLSIMVGGSCNRRAHAKWSAARETASLAPIWRTQQ